MPDERHGFQNVIRAGTLPRHRHGLRLLCSQDERAPRSVGGVEDARVSTATQVVGRAELQRVAEDARARVDAVLGQLAKEPEPAAPEAGTRATAEHQTGGLSDQVEERLFRLFLEAADAISGGDALQDSTRIFELAKAYAAVASLKRAEEVELHLA